MLVSLFYTIRVIDTLIPYIHIVFIYKEIAMIHEH